MPVLKLPILERVAKETIGQWVYRSLRHAVMIGMVPPGRALTIRDIASVLGVSTMPVREALRRLSTEQALEVLDNRRIMVPNMTAAKFKELYEMRIAIECHAAERAMPYIGDTQLDQLKKIDEIIDEAYAVGDMERLITYNHKFHRYIYESNPNQVAMPLVESIWLQLGPFVRLALSHLQESYLVDRHSEALKALQRQDPLGLRLAVEGDIRDGMTHVGTNELLKAYIESPDLIG